MNRINQNQFFDILFYLRGFFAFLLIPLLLLLNIEYFNNILLHSNIYLFKNRSPNLTYPLMYVVEYYDKYIIDIYKFILIFDLILLTTYYFLNQCRLQIPHIFYLKIDNTQLLNNSSKIFFTLLPLCFFFDLLNMYMNLTDVLLQNKSIKIRVKQK